MDMIASALKLTDDTALQANDEAAWHALRLEGIGGSDIGKLCGAYGPDPPEWGTPLSVYRSKTEPPEVDDGRALDRLLPSLGSYLEDFIARLYEESTGLHTIKVPMCCDPESPWRRASADRLICEMQDVAAPGQRCELQARPVGVLEIKRPGAFNKQWSGDDAPAYARMQAQWYADIFGLEHVHVAALVSDTNFRIFRYTRDAELAAIMTAEADAFWNENVLPRVPPEPMPSELRGELERRFPDVRKGLLDADEAQDELADRLTRCKDRLKLYEARKRELEDALLATLEGSEGVKGSWGSFTWRKGKRGRTAWKAMAEHLLPEFDQERQTAFLKQFTGQPQRSARFNPRRKK